MLVIAGGFFLAPVVLPLVFALAMGVVVFLAATTLGNLLMLGLVGAALVQRYRHKLPRV
ncbi:MAG: hypothetical protein AAFV62_07210 [Pseudomonadota bacterium]